MSQRPSTHPARSARLSILDGALAALAVAGVLLTSIALVLQRTAIELAGVRISLRNPARPFVLAAVAMLVWAWLNPERCDALLQRTKRTIGRLPRWLAPLAIGALVVIAGLRAGASVASGADSYGYITQAEMLSEWRTRRPEPPLAASATWTDSRLSMAPLGWLPAEPGTQVPVYPPGYPLLMAAARTIDTRLMGVVVPVSGAVTMLALMAIAALVGRRELGWAAAVLLGTSPAFLMSLVVPMSDLPATAAWTVAMAAALAPGVSSALMAGLAGGMGILIRPNLLPLALAVIALSAASGRDSARLRVWRAGAAAIGLGLGALCVAAFQWSYYGSPTANGYGRLEDLFAVRYWSTNVAQFSMWLMSTQATVALIGTGAAVLARARDAHRMPWLLLALPALTLACYLFYLPFDNWTYLRFLLPGLPIVMLWSAAGLAWVTRVAPGAAGRLAFVLLIVWCGLGQFHEARVRHVFANAASVQRFEDVSRAVQQRVPPASVVVTREFSGSLQYYAGLQTVRWDRLDAASLTRAVTQLQAAGLPVFALLDERSELPDFKTRFPDLLPSRLDVVQTYAGSAERITLYRWRPVGQ
jgi:hypothetical protein